MSKSVTDFLSQKIIDFYFLEAEDVGIGIALIYTQVERIDVKERIINGTGALSFML